MTWNGARRLVPALLLLFLAGLPGRAQTPPAGGKAPAGNAPLGEFKAAVLGTLRPGEPFVVAAAGKGVPQGASGFARMRAVLIKGGKELNRAFFFNLGELTDRGPAFAALMAVPTTAGAGAAVLRLETAGRVLRTLDITIGDRQFLTETISLTGEMSDILSKPDPEKTRQAEAMWAIWVTTGETVYAPGNFIMPVNSTVQTSRFGGRRVYQYPDGRTSASIHAGVDWRAPTGTPLSAPAPGRVVLARPRIVTGNTVVIEHMPGVYSLYYHMDKIAAAEGDIVQAGTPLGTAGATGFATGAHLHWEIRVAAENTDPEAFLGKKVLDKEEILRILNE